jgi:hypothetical protein
MSGTNIELPLWQVIALAVSFGGAVMVWGKLLFSQFEKRLAERFKAHDDTLARFVADQGTSAKRMQELERDFLLFRGEMPNQYVRRDDFIRNQTVIEAKLDSISTRVENIQLRGQYPHG